MSAEIDSIISSAMTSIDDGGSDGGDTGDSGSSDSDFTGSGDPSTDLSAADTADAGADAGAEGAEAADASGQPADAGAAGADAGRTAEELAFDAELAELGLSAPKPGQRDNRIPYSRIRKIVANAKTKWSEKLTGEHTKELSARDEQIKANAERQAQFDAAEKLIASDPDRYIQLLGQIYPDKYKGFTKAEVKAAVAAAQEKPQEPQPDVKYEDGSLGYSPEQFAKLREYDRKEAARQAKDETSKEFNERFGPIEQQYKDAQRDQQDITRVRGDIGKLRDQWGGDLIDNPEVQKAIVAHMDANPKDTLVAATRTVAMAHIAADRTKMRAEILAELKGAPKAAAKVPAAPNKSDTSGESLDDIIRAAARSIR